MAGRKTLVYVEDEPDMIELVKLIFRGKGFRLIAALDGREGLKTIRRIRPDLVLLDLMLPAMSGWEVHQAMKDDDAIKDIPVIVVSVKEPRAEQRGGWPVSKVNDYVTKPFRVGRLRQAVHEALSLAA